MKHHRILLPLIAVAAAIVAVTASSAQKVADELERKDPTLTAVETLQLDRKNRAAASIQDLSRYETIASLEDGDIVGTVFTDAVAGRIDLAQRLLRLGLALKREGEDVLAEQAASAALAHLNAAEALINPIAAPELSAQALELKGFIYERVRNDHASARSNYQAAKERDPNSTAAGRLKQLDAVSGGQKIPPGKGGTTPPAKG